MAQTSAYWGPDAPSMDDHQSDMGGGGMVLAPPLFIARLGWALRNRPALWEKFLASLPVLVAIFSYCAWSEALGYLRGANTSREEFRARELETHRDAS